MTKNRVVCLSLYRGMNCTHVTVTRDTYRHVYEHPGCARIQRLCHLVTALVQQRKMSVYLWPEGFWANPLSERL